MCISYTVSHKCIFEAHLSDHNYIIYYHIQLINKTQSSNSVNVFTDTIMNKRWEFDEVAELLRSQLALLPGVCVCVCVWQ